MAKFLALVAVCLSIAVFAQAQSYRDLLPLPSGLSNQNGKTYLKLSTMTRIFGNPCSLTQECSSVTNSKLRSLLVTESVGKFRVTGIRPAVRALQRVFAKVADEKPALYEALNTAGMLCCRAVRGSSTSYSNHAWGAAIDFTVNGVLDPRSDGKAQRGLHELYPYMSAEGFFWAAGYSASSEDAMHFEVAEQTMLAWEANNFADTSSSGSVSSGSVSSGTVSSSSGSSGLPSGPQCTSTSWPVYRKDLTRNPPEVWALQYLLNAAGAVPALTVDGYFGTNSENAVKNFQTRNGLTADGIVGKNTWERLYTPVSSTQGNSHAARAMQYLLARKYGKGITVDGIFGANSINALKEYQREKSLPVQSSVSLEAFKSMIASCYGNSLGSQGEFEDEPSDAEVSSASTNIVAGIALMCAVPLLF